MGAAASGEKSETGGLSGQSGMRSAMGHFKILAWLTGELSQLKLRGTVLVGLLTLVTATAHGDSPLKSGPAELKIGQQASLTAQLIIDAVVADDPVQLVMKPSAKDQQFLSEALPEFCLLNVTGQITYGLMDLTPGKLMCITADKRIMEGKVKGELAGDAQCDNCQSIELKAGQSFRLNLSEDVILKLQARADQPS